MTESFFEPSQVLRKKFMFARVVDYCLYYLAIMGAVALSPWFVEGMIKGTLILSLPILWAPLGAIFMRYWGRTPGMFLFGLKAKDEQGKPLPFKLALKQALLPMEDAKSGVFLSCQTGRLRHIAAILIGLFCIFVSLGQKEFSMFSPDFKQSLVAGNWVHYTHPEEGFSIQFPSDPSEESKELELPEGTKSLNYTEMSSEKRKAVYSLSYMSLPRKWSIAGDNTILKTCLELMMEFFDKAELNYKTMTHYKNYKALDFAYTLDGEEVQGRLVMVGSTLYKLAVQHPKSAKPSEEVVQGFFDSFEPKG